MTEKIKIMNNIETEYKTFMFMVDKSRGVSDKQLTEFIDTRSMAVSLNVYFYFKEFTFKSKRPGVTNIVPMGVMEPTNISPDAT